MVDMMNNGHASMMGGMGVLAILFWVLIIAGIIFIAKWFLERNRGESDADKHLESALDILKKRYARGEIDRETYEQMKKDIIG